MARATPRSLSPGRRQRTSASGTVSTLAPGVRWFSPMGPLRFEYGFPINPRPDERRAVFDFYIGSLF